VPQDDAATEDDENTKGSRTTTGLLTVRSLRIGRI